MTKNVYTSIIIDNELHCIETLKYEIGANCNNVEIISTHQDALGGIKAINDSKPDIVFLDIELDNATGFQLVENLSFRDFHLIFTTAYDQYTIEALRIKAADYLLKPVSGKSLVECLNRIIQTSTNSTAQPPKEVQKMSLATGSSTLFIDPLSIKYITADGNYAKVYMSDGCEHHASRSLKQLEEELNGDNFVRVHKSYLINLKHMKAHHKADGGFLEMSDGQLIPLSKVSIKDITEKLR